MRKTIPRFTVKLTLSTLLLASLVLLGPAVSAQQVDFSNYVALGDSLGAGVMSGGLVDTLQEQSYTAHIYRQINGSLNGFALPTISPPGLNPLLQLVGLAPTVIRPASGRGVPTNLGFEGLYTNMCVPGATVDSVLNLRTDNGGLFDVTLRGLGTQLELTLAQQPSFVTFWVNNDALAAATSGVILEDITLTSLPVFEAKFRAITGTLAGAGADLALATIPYVTTIPFVTTVPPVLVDPVTNQPVLIQGQPVPLLGPDGPLTLGQDFVLLSGTAELAAGFGIPAALGGRGEPLSNQAVLWAAVGATINGRVDQFNAVIRTVATELGAALVDVNGIFADIAINGLDIGGITFDADFLTGGLFSYDGVHPTPLGYAIMANEWIKAINAQFGSDIPLVNLFPYIFGPQSSFGTGFPVGASGAFVMTPKASNAFRDLMGVPSRQRINRILRRRGLGL